MSDNLKLIPKQYAGYYAADQVTDGMIVGLGTGSTVAFTMEHLAERIKSGLKISGIPTSLQTAIKARNLGIPLTTLEENDVIDLTIDGADQVDPIFNLIKGRGAAHVRERCIAELSKKLFIVVDESKLVEKLSGPVPVEVVPFALPVAIRRLTDIGGNPLIREGVKKDGPVFSDNGNIILDCHALDITNPKELQYQLNNIPGIVGCGIFAEYSDKTTVIIGINDGYKVIKPKR